MKTFLNRFSPLLVILVLAGFFRLYKLSELQFWSVDDEIFWAVVRRMVDQQTLTLVSPNGTLGISLGSFFHILSIPLYFLASPDKFLLAGSVLGIATTMVIYLAGKELAGNKAGLLAAFFYSISFIASLADRRWWPLTPDPFLSALSLFSALKVAKGHLQFLLPLVVAASFAWHADPSLAVLALGSAAVIMVFRRKILFPRRYLILPILYLVFSVLPLAFFELRHPGAITGPAANLLNRLGSGEQASSLPLVAGWQHLTLAFFPTPTNFAELFFHCQDCPSPFLYPVTPLILFALVLLVFLRAIVDKQRILLVPFFYLGAYFFGVTIYKLLFKAIVYQSYSFVILPIFFVVVAQSLVKLKKVFVVVFIAAFLVTNVNSLLNSQMRYSLKAKLAIVDSVIAKTNSQKISLEVIDGGQYFQGFAGLFLFRGVCPANQSYYAPWDWYYRAYSLYSCEPETSPSYTHVIFSKSDILVE